MLNYSASIERMVGESGKYRSWKRQTVLTALLLFAMTFAVARIPVAFFPLHQVQSQDVVPLIVLAASLLVVAFLIPRWRLPAHLPSAGWLAATSLVMVGLLALGTHSLMGNLPLSADERMVVFDMAVFDSMRLAAPLAASWRPYATTLVPAFLLYEDMPTGLVSAYLPMNALLRLAFSKVADPAIFNPLLVLVGGAALLDIARRTFGRNNPACWVILLIYALSAQTLVAAMTTYSMTAHMALNLIWLAAFLRGGYRGHSVAILTGFVATGLHQIAFHPFFVAPFLLWQFRQGDRKLVLIYGAAYLAIILWWAYYPILAGYEVAGGLQQPPHSSLIDRISTAFAERRGDTAITMFLNLLRFVAWQNVAMLPLLVGSITVVVRDGELPAALLLSIFSWLIFVAVVIPFQGHGWGYRYLHPYLGNFALLAGYGYQELKEVIGEKVDGLVLSLSGVTAVATIPLTLIATYKFLEPHVALERVITAQQTPMVLIDTYPRPTTDGKWASNAIENVLNLPDLSNRPLRLSTLNMNGELLAGLCRKGKITLIGRAEQQRAGFALNAARESPSFAKLTNTVRRKMPHCLVSARGLPQ